MPPVHGQERWRGSQKAAEVFHNSHGSLRRLVPRGQDLCCFKCLHLLQWKISSAIIPCDGCGSIKTRKDFSAEAQRRWEALSNDVLLCRPCNGEGKQKREDGNLIFCNGACQRALPEYHFVAAMVVDWQAANLMLAAKCARCVVKDMHPSKDTEYVCKTCTKVKHVTAFGPAQMKERIGNKRTEYRWTCYDCLFSAVLHVLAR